MDKIYYEYTENRIKAEVWNREYDFDRSVFPTSVKIAGKEILHAPIRLTAEFGDVSGTFADQAVVFTGSGEDFAHFTVAETAENIIVNSDITIEEDGFIRIDLRLMNFWSFSEQNKPRLSGLYIDIPIKKEFAGLMHYWPNCESGVCLSQKVLNSHSVPDGRTELGFKPYIWAGWEYGGLGICMESSKGFELQDGKSAMIFENNDEFVNIRIDLLDNIPADWQGREDKWGDTLKPLMFTLGLQATPVKRFAGNSLTDWRVFHISNVYYKKILKEYQEKNHTADPEALLRKIADLGVKWIILHESWAKIQNYGIPWDEDEFVEFIRLCHKFNMKVMTYFGYEISTLYPNFNEICGKWLNKNTDGNYVGGWQREPAQRDFTVCYNGGYSDVMIERVKYVMDHYGVDGIYTDGTHVPWECANTEHGCGYIDKQGKLCFEYPIFALRKHVKKLYKEIHKRGGLLDTHQSSCCMMATLSYADSFYDGENIQGMIIDDIKKLRLDTFRCEFTGYNMGIPCNFISYTQGDYTMRKIAGITFIHNVFPRAGKMDDLEFMSKLWGIIDKYGLRTDNFHGYWEQEEITTADDSSYASYYDIDKGIIISAVNHNTEKDHIDLVFKEEYKEIEDLSDGNKVYKIENKKVSIPASPLDLHIYKIGL